MSAAATLTASAVAKCPYKGFSPYGPDDAPLFAGRDRDNREFSRLLADPDVSVVVLHGPSACGKTSFLQAGVIPYLERGRGFEFLKSPDGLTGTVGGAGRRTATTQALFIRATENPFRKLALAVYQVARTPYIWPAPDGTESVDLSRAALDCSTAETFLKLLDGDPPALCDSLQVIAGLAPTKFVFIIDQAEEVLTLASDPAESQRFFDFLGAFSDRRLPLRIIIALRTEFFGVFQARMRRSAAHPLAIDNYLLDPLDKCGLKEAIVRPTGACPYRFEGGVADRIVAEVQETTAKGGLTSALPLVQVVCETLYNETKHRWADNGSWNITAQDYADLGPTHQLLTKYINRVIETFFSTCKLRPGTVEDQTRRWKDTLAVLAARGGDNSVVTDLVSVQALRNAATKSGARFADEMIGYLSADDQSILRVEKRDPDNAEMARYSLRHDTIGLVLLSWKTAREVAFAFARIFRAYQLLLLAVSVLASVVGARAWYSGDHSISVLALLAVSIGLIGSSLALVRMDPVRKKAQAVNVAGALAGALVVLAYLAFAQHDYKNPVFIGHYPDPSVVKSTDGKYWAVTTSSGTQPPLFPILSSSDLVNWHVQGNVFPKTTEAEAAALAKSLGDNYFWAPHITRYNDHYFVYYVAGYSTDQSKSIRLAIADKPEGPYVDLGRPLVADPSNCGYTDPFVFKSGGKQYLVWKQNLASNCHGTAILAQQLAPDGKSLTGVMKTLLTSESRDDNRQNDWEKKDVGGPAIVELDKVRREPHPERRRGLALSGARLRSPRGGRRLLPVSRNAPSARLLSRTRVRAGSYRMGRGGLAVVPAQGNVGLGAAANTRSAVPRACPADVIPRRLPLETIECGVAVALVARRRQRGPRRGSEAVAPKRSEQARRTERERSHLAAGQSRFRCDYQGGVEQRRRRWIFGRPGYLRRTGERAGRDAFKRRC